MSDKLTIALAQLNPIVGTFQETAPSYGMRARARQSGRGFNRDVRAFPVRLSDRRPCAEAKLPAKPALRN